MDIIRDIQAYAMQVDKPSSYRFHMAISLGGAIIVLATLLCRDLATIDLQDHRPSYAESYRLGMSMLRDLAVTLPSAGRILDDLRKIVDVVDIIIQDRSPGALQQEDFTNLVPPNMDDLLPYNMVVAGRDMDTDQLEQMYGVGGTGFAGPVSPDQEHVLSKVWDSWDSFELMMTPVGQGVPWV
ncbi:Beta-1,4-mannosyl-glycoprotein 4-beta-N-acetylglucosaminyltransferase [Purpureocillium lavendulum]|uniref:Beta-1,4-mannosyl-glycoprotein 4-beta-N-acetylglucosaminyltransferase n=1 Tax=Purpureocillium lavendulum TaxID=1247861 RepID=A0AB34G2Z3_9HYPO|nr:Beta-1,4-mannosyl-glycoprotein 4-beta-N-acetylglucosaminyltransferase [Purpureocillium lavendulum]